jgi:hypothetical protein
MAKQNTRLHIIPRLTNVEDSWKSPKANKPIARNSHIYSIYNEIS